ncbi:MAG: hypothetical protein ACYC3S_11370 [Chloroflexota bacterium]
MGLLESFQNFRDYFFLVPNGASPMQRAVDNASAVSRQHRPYGPEATPPGLPADIPVYKARGFRHGPRVSRPVQGSISMVYVPRSEFDEVTAFYEEQLPTHRWMIAEVHDDSGDDFRARRFDVEKDGRRGAIAVEETRQDVGPLERKVVTVSIDITALG